MGDTVQVVLGSDFASVSPPKPSGSSVQVHVLHEHQQHPDPAAGGPLGHQRRRHHLRVAAALAAARAGGIHLSFTLHIVTIHRISP